MTIDSTDLIGLDFGLRERLFERIDAVDFAPVVAEPLAKSNGASADAPPAGANATLSLSSSSRSIADQSASSSSAMAGTCVWPMSETTIKVGGSCASASASEYSSWHNGHRTVASREALSGTVTCSQQRGQLAIVMKISAVIEATYQFSSVATSSRRWLVFTDRSQPRKRVAEAGAARLQCLYPVLPAVKSEKQSPFADCRDLGG